MDEKKFNILIVDDMPENIQVAASILNQQGYDIAFAMNGKDALNQVKAIKVDLILLDIMMPEMDGFEVCQLLKKDTETADIPVIFLSARNETESIVKGFQLGAVDYITKPFNSFELLARVKTHLSLKQAREELAESNLLLKRTNTQLQELNATKDKFFSIIAHDLRNPFNALISGTSIMMEHYNSFSERDIKSLLEGMHSSAKLAFNLLQNLLEWSRSQTGQIRCEPEVINIKEYINRTADLLENHAKEKGIRLINELDEFFPAYADPEMTETILRNLISNAVKYTKDGGEVRISAKKSEATVEISVSDTGIGIKPNDMEKLFRIDIKYSTPGTSNEQGTGLGLNLCKEFVEKNRGKIWAESEAGKGSRFIFTLPKKAEA